MGVEAAALKFRLVKDLSDGFRLPDGLPLPAGSRAGLFRDGAGVHWLAWGRRFEGLTRDPPEVGRVGVFGGDGLLLDPFSFDSGDEAEEYARAAAGAATVRKGPSDGN